VESMEVVIPASYAALSLNLSTDVKPCFISRGKWENKYLNGFVPGKVRVLGGGGRLFVLPTVETWLMGVCHEIT
jgi:hypothetical protein